MKWPIVVVFRLLNAVRLLQVNVPLTATVVLYLVIVVLVLAMAGCDRVADTGTPDTAATPMVIVVECADAAAITTANPHEL